jgi:hypothetical protein
MIVKEKDSTEYFSKHDQKGREDVKKKNLSKN